MSRTVKNVQNASGSARQRHQIKAATSAPLAPPMAARTKISSKHQVTIAKAPFTEAGFKAGDIVAVRALGPGRLELTSLDTLFDRYRGCITTDSGLRRNIDESRNEW